MDDFIGTGDEALNTWDQISGLLNSDIDTYLVTVVGYDSAIKMTESETSLKVIPSIRLRDSEKLFHQDNTNFQK